MTLLQTTTLSDNLFKTQSCWKKMFKENRLVLFCLCFCHLVGVFGDTDTVKSVSVKEGDSVTLQINVTEIQTDDKIEWKFGTERNLVAKINGKTSKIFDGPEGRFRDRLKLDHQTGSLIITNTRTTDSGLYKLKIINTGSKGDKIFSVSVHGVSAAQRNEMKRKSVKEGESVTLDPGVVKNPNDVMTWYFNDSLIAEITGDQSEICSDDECKERFRDRLKLDHQTGSLTITNTRITDSGEYKLQITNSSSFSISRISTVLTVIAVPDSGLSPAAGAGIGVVVVLLISAAAAAAVFLCRKARRKNTQNNRDQENYLQVLSPDQSMTPCIPPEVNTSC